MSNKSRKKNNTMIILSNLSDVAGTVGAIAKIFSVMSQTMTEEEKDVKKK